MLPLTLIVFGCLFIFLMAEWILVVSMGLRVCRRRGKGLGILFTSKWVGENVNRLYREDYPESMLPELQRYGGYLLLGLAGLAVVLSLVLKTKWVGN